MSMNLKYTGGFRSIAGRLYEIEIYENEFAGEPSTVAFCDEPLEIEWPETDKLEPVQSSNATLRLYCDDDRQFVDMYTVVAGNVRMDVYRDGALYWSGTLDPELWEEPFAYKSDYGVTLTFADMAILDRLSWDRKGFVTLREIILYVLRKSGVRYGTFHEFVSTRLSEYDSRNLLDSISVNSDNFFDEEGEPLTMREVLDETLRPFSLRLIQKEGDVFVYDLNAVYTALEPRRVGWVSDNSVLGVDKVYNNVTLTFSPYEKSTLIKGVVDPDSVPTGTKLTTGVYTQSTNEEIGFYTYLSNAGKGLEKHPSARFFKIEPVHSGSECTGVAWTVKTFRSGSQNSYISYVQEATSSIGSMLLKVPDIFYLSYIGLDRRNFKLKVKVDLLFDVRYNPFEEAVVQNEKKDSERLKNWCNFAYVPFKLTLRDEGGKALYHWENKGVKDSRSYVHTWSNCRWVAGEAVWGDAWLCWYEGDRKSETGLAGWQTNKQIIGYYRDDDLPVLFKRLDAGEYIDLPGKDGYLELEIGTGVPCYDYGDKNSPSLRDDINDKVRWLLYRNPTVELVDKYGNALTHNDVEQKAWINRAAKEEIKIDTILGTLAAPSPIALGQLYATSDKSVKKTFYRAEREDRLERLLIGTVYSNYAVRHNTLSGTVEILDAFGIYTDNNEPGNFMLMSENQDLRNDTSEIKMVQFETDNYEGVDFETV